MQLGYTMPCEQTAPKQLVRDLVRAEHVIGRGGPSADAKHGDTLIAVSPDADVVSAFGQAARRTL